MESGEKGSDVKNRRFGVNLLGLLAGGLMTAAMFFPWWSFIFEFNTEMTYVYPYLIQGPGSELVGYKRSPLMALLTGVLIAAIVLCLVGSLLKGKTGRIMLGASGVLVLLGAWRLLVRVLGVADRYGIPFHGEGAASYEIFAVIKVRTSLEAGLFLCVLGGILALAAAFLDRRVSLGD
ncbi:MAG: hypothetical protein PHS96_08785 [Anaerolineales bacterium]|nr:hypothetical protein [Anaerolineales bacterium]